MIVFVSDIYGSGPALTSLVNDLALHCGQYQIVDPYHGQVRGFKDENTAYQAFQDSGGLDEYIAHIATIFNELNNDHGSLLVIAFSAGAAASFKALNHLPKQGCVQSILFYPGQIRHYLQDVCMHPTKIIFPKSELCIYLK